MPTVSEVISKVELQGTIPDSIKYRWLGELDKRVFRYPDDADAELKYPFNIYKLYLIAMDNFFRYDMAAYQESAMEFRRAYAKEWG